MKTIGQILKESRTTAGLSLEKLEKETKIKKCFLVALEEEDWKHLPVYAVVLGFVKSVADVLRLDSRKMVALFRRDYPPQPIAIAPKPDISKRFSWNPKLTFAVLVAVVGILVGGYLLFQYINFARPPRLVVYQPKDGETVIQSMVTVAGKTEADVLVRANNQPLLVDSEGNFSADVEINDKTSQIEIIAETRTGKVTKVIRKIITQFK